MKLNLKTITRTHLTIGFVAALAVLALASAVGMPLVSPDFMAHLAAIGAPMALAGEVGGDVKKALEQLTDAAKSAQSAVAEMKKSHEALDGRVAKLHEELATGKADAVTKAAFQDAVAKVEKSEKTLDKLNLELTEMAKKMTNVFGSTQAKKSLGATAAGSDNAKNYQGGNSVLCNWEGSLHTKAAGSITSDPASAGALGNPYRVPGVYTDPAYIPTVRDLLMAVSISEGIVEFAQEKLFTNNAAMQAGEGAAKAQSTITFEKKTVPVQTLAHWFLASRQVLSDVPQLQGMIDVRGVSGLKLKEDFQLLLGDGTGSNLLGLVPQSTVYNPAGMPAVAAGGPAHTAIDHLRWGFLQVSKAGYPATFAALSLEDWAIIQMMKTADGAYIFGSPTDGAEPRIWGKRVAESYSLPTGEFLAGSALAATIYDRENVTVRVAEQHGTTFVENMVTILIEERLALAVHAPKAMVAGQFPA